MKKEKKQPAPNPNPNQWRNRIVGHGEVDTVDLLSNPKNYRIHPGHQQDAMNEILSDVGWVQSIIVNKATGFVVDGHLRAALAVKRQERVPVTYVELTAEEESLVLAALDPLAGLAVPDASKLTELLAEVSLGEGSLAELLSGLQTQAGKTALHPVNEAGAEKRHLGEKAAQIKPVLYAPQIATFERAIKKTGIRNRGQAIIEICRAYLEYKERQLDVLAEVAASAPKLG